jgi:hypothetical protein
MLVDWKSARGNKAIRANPIPVPLGLKGTTWLLGHWT